LRPCALLCNALQVCPEMRIPESMISLKDFLLSRNE
jgi:hypothetical protein